MLSFVLLTLYFFSRTEAIPYKKDYDINYGLSCTYVRADGAGGTEINIGTTKSASECLKKCEIKRKDNIKINGATFSPTSKKCYCEVGQTKQSINSIWQNCWFGKKVPTTDVSCTYVRADGAGGSEHSIGTTKSGSECVKECNLLKKTNTKINGATFSPTSKKCYCEVGQTKQSISSTWENCWFGKNVPTTERRCFVKTNDGWGASDINVGKAKDMKDCSTSCMKLYVVDKTINGATFEKYTGKCRCEQNQIGYYENSSQYLNCKFG